MKKILLIIVFLLILAAIPLTILLVKQRQEIRQKAVPATTLYLDPATITTQPNDTFTVNVMIRTGENLVTAAELHFSFNSTYLEAQSIQNGSFLENVLVPGTVDSGTASITLGSSPTEPKQTVGDVPAVLAVLTFKALAETGSLNPPSTAIEFLNTTQVAAVGEGANNVLIGTQRADVTIGTGAGASPSPSTSTSPSPSTSTSPSPSPDTSPSPSPSASPQQTVITSPANDSSTSNHRVPISGASFANALIILSINTSPVLSTTFYADASGNWTYTPATDIANGIYTITVTGESSTGVTETATSTFTVSDGTGGTLISPTPTTSSTPNSTTTTSPATSESSVPVTGTAGPTIFLFVLAAFLIIVGVGTSIFPRF